MKAMKLLGTSALMFAVATTAFAAETATQFEIETLNSQPRDMVPGLDLFETSGGSLTWVTKDSPSEPIPTSSIRNLTLKFKNAPDLTVRALNRVENGFASCSGPNGGDSYFGEVNNQWIFRTVEVTLCANHNAGIPTLNFDYVITVKDSESYTSGEVTQGMLRLTEGTGFANDVTPNKVVDNLRTTFNGKTLKLNLLQRQAEENLPYSGIRFGWIVKASWMGHGDLPLVIDDYVATPSSKAIALVSSVMPGPEGDIEMISVRSIDEFGTAQESAPMDLRYILEQSYGPLPLPAP